jgi:hypothetical protein
VCTNPPRDIIKNKICYQMHQDKIRSDHFINVQQLTIDRSKGLLGTSETIQSGSASAAPIKAYLTSMVKDLDHLRKRKIDTNLGVPEKKGSFSRTLKTKRNAPTGGPWRMCSRYRGVIVC